MLNRSNQSNRSNLESFDTNIIILDKGLKLYHLGYLNNEKSINYFKEEDEDEEQIKKRFEGVPKDEINTKPPSSLMFFALHRDHPYDAIKGVQAYAEFVTTKPIVIFDIGNKNILNSPNPGVYKYLYKTWVKPWEKSIPAKFMDCLHGWIGYDDYGNPWREIALFNAKEFVSKGKPYNLDTSKRGPRWTFPHESEELEYLHEKLIGCFKSVIYFSDDEEPEIKILSQSHCDSPSLKKTGWK